MNKKKTSRTVESSGPGWSQVQGAALWALDLAEQGGMEQAAPDRSSLQALP